MKKPVSAHTILKKLSKSVDEGKLNRADFNRMEELIEADVKLAEKKKEVSSFKRKATLLVKKNEKLLADIEAYKKKQLRLEEKALKQKNKVNTREVKKIQNAAANEIKGLQDNLTLSENKYLGLESYSRNLSNQLAKSEDEKERYRQNIQELELTLSEKNADIGRLEALVDSLYSSTSWRLSKPIRVFRRALKDPMTVLGDGRRKALKPSSTQSIESLDKDSLSTSEVTASHKIVKEDINADVFSPKFQAPILKNKPVRLICFHLPQFHPIKENNEWWGEGFTEWTNVRPAQPQFDGHYQPHIPGDLGYYDLSETKALRNQIDLAKQYGIEAFCYYFYWFAGKRLLETPVQNHLEDKSLDFPFCLCWANENWSRRWDGLDQELLISQDHSDDDDLAFIEHISQYMMDPRYIRIDGKPMLLVYRPSLLPAALQTTMRWRNWCRENGIGEIFLAYTQSFEAVDPKTYGFDAAVEFPPNNSAPPDVTKAVKPLRDDFSCKVYDWDVFLKRSESYADPGYPIFRSVCPSWDNTARRKNNATVFLNSSPRKYGQWLSNAITDTKKRFSQKDERLIFVNAWNEWAEGAHLEPDERYGYSYLNETRMALEGRTGETRKRIVLVGHDAHPHGAQFLVLNLVKNLSERFQYDVDLVVLGDGPLMDEYKAIATVHDLTGIDPLGDEAQKIAQNLFKHADAAISNTTVSGLFVKTLKDAGFRVVSLIHELQSVIEGYGLQSQVEHIVEYSDKIIFPATLVSNSFAGFAPDAKAKTMIRPQGAYKKNKIRSQKDLTAANAKLRKKIGIAKDKKIVLGVGYADERKGFDLFIESVQQVTQRNKNVVFLWLGHLEVHLSERLSEITSKLCAEKKLILPGRVLDTDLYYAGSDLYLLTSREDPYPSTVLESLDVGLPIIGFEGATGTTGLIAEHGGALIEQFNVKALSSKIGQLLKNNDRSVRWARTQKFRQRPDVSFQAYIYDILEVLKVAPKSVTVVVPNYNYARFLHGRIDSILKQSYPVREIILLDDCSTDDSVEVIEKLLDSLDVPIKFVQNKKNSGSVFKQWKSGAELSSYDYLWIAEADDLSEPDFLKNAMHGFENEDVVLSYTQSKQMAHDGTILCDNYLDYTNIVSSTQWNKNYKRSGIDETVNGMSIKNTIPNVSAVVFKKDILSRILDENFDHILQFRVAGDWCVYVHALKYGSCYFDARSCNLHRRHDESVTISKFGNAELNEIIEMQAFIDETNIIQLENKARAQAYIQELKAQFKLH